MDISRLINTTCIIVGGAIAIYANAEKQQSTTLLIIGIILLMIGVYRTSRNIPSKTDSSESENSDTDETI